jgi:hypothetical protein
MTNSTSSFSRRLLISAAVVSVVTIAMSTSTTKAEADEDPYTREALRELGWINNECGTNITLAPIDKATFEKYSGGMVAPCKIFGALRPFCHQDSGKPHPAGQAFIKENIKTISCTMTPDTDKPEVKLSISGGNLSYRISPKWSIGSETEEALKKDATFKKIFEKRRVWDLQNVQIPEQTAKIKETCDADVKMTIDIPSFQARGYVLSYPDLAVADLCMSFGYGIYDSCKEDKAGTLSRVRGIRCSMTREESDANAKVRIVNNEVVVEVSKASADGYEARTKVKTLIKAASPASASSPSTPSTPSSPSTPTKKSFKKSSKSAGSRGG